MIIVSQNKRRTVNFNKIVEVFIEYPKKESKDNKYIIKYEKPNGNTGILAKYQSEKQAESVLMNFNQAYMLQGQAIQLDNGMTQYQAPMFYMPEEKKEVEE